MKERVDGNDGTALGGGGEAKLLFLTGGREYSKRPDIGTRWPFAYMHW